jgi:hypothetical protein
MMFIVVSTWRICFHNLKSVTERKKEREGVIGETFYGGGEENFSWRRQCLLFIG